jgi:hypothetical protein
MKQRNKVIYVTMLLTICMAVTPAMGSMIKADHKTLVPIQTNAEKLVTIEFVDCTNAVPIKKEITMPKAEWISIQNELRAIKSGLSVQDTLIAQLAVYKKHHLVSNEVTTKGLLQKFNKKMESVRIPALIQKIHTTPIINNSIFNAMCAILFTLDNGTTAVLGLNSFINLIGFDIVSFHKGYASTDIVTTGILQRSVPPGNYVGAMFGFFGYWSGERVSVGIYHSLTAAGFTVFTVWLPIPASA